MCKYLTYLTCFFLLLSLFGSNTVSAVEEIWGEAEIVSSLTSPLQIIDDATASGGQYITVEPGNDSSPNPPSTGIATYTISVSEGGVYRMYLRVLCSPDVDAESSDSCWIRIQGADLNMEVGPDDWIRNNNIDYLATNPQDWFWSQLRHYYEAYPGDNFIEMTMDPGNYTLEIAYREDGLWIDGFLITNDPDVDPTTLPDEIPFIPAGISTNPNPADQEEDVYYKTILSWTPGKIVEIPKHNLFLGTNFDDVNEATIEEQLEVNIVAENLDMNSFDPGDLEFGVTYYWRIDDVNSSDSTVFKSDVWSFTVEPLAYPIPAAKIIPTASSQSEGWGPEKTIDGSGLDENNLHSVNAADMWLSAPGDPGSAWIQYEFDKLYKLHEMLIWNYNGDTILTLYGIKEVTIEYSADGATWNQANVSELAQASGTADYVANTIVPFDGAQVKYIKITANNNWIGGTGIFNQYGLSEVRFLHIPVSARKPIPEDGATDVAIDTNLSWRPGREAAQHIVYLSTDQQSVIDGTAPATTVNQPVDGPLSLDLGSIYYWRVDEVNNLEAIQTWPGDVWSFMTQEYLVVDDFESYNDILTGEADSNLVYETWIDGYDNPATNGSTMGYVSGASMETEIVYGGKQSAPLSYDNTGASLSEVTVDPGKLPIGRDWTKSSPQTLVLWIYGDLGNTGDNQLYVKIGNSRFQYVSDIKKPYWNPIIVDLTGVNLNNVSSLTIGLERIGSAGGSGMILLDEIRLYRVALQPPEVIWLEAEAADSIEAPMMIYDDPNASGGQYIMKDPNAATSTSNPPADGLAAYQFTVVNGGVYKITGRVITTGNNDSFWLRIPDVTMNVAGDPSNPGWIEWNGLTQEDVWGWEDVFSSNDDNVTVEFTLEAGTYTLEIRYRENESQLDALMITQID